MRQIAIVADIHGDHLRLRAALSSLVPLVDEIIFVGDYVDRGAGSREVLQDLSDLSSNWAGHVTLLRGNHDMALLEFLHSGSASEFLSGGGLSTVRSYSAFPLSPDPIGDFRKNFPAEHLQLLQGTKLYVEREGLFVSHCGFNPDDPFDRTEGAMVRGSFPKLFALGKDSIRPQQDVVFGHYIQPRGEVFERDGIICLDTGCGSIPGGALSVLIFPAKQIMHF